MSKPLHIGILGSRGIPNAYGGFEQFAQYLATGLVQRGHTVAVYQSSAHPYEQPTFENVQLIRINDPEPRIGTAGQFLYDLRSNRDARNRNFDVLYHLGYTSDSVWGAVWPRNTLHVVNMDGLEWKRSKYSKKVQRFLRWAEKKAVRHAHHLIADSEGIQQYLKQTYGASSTFIPYGAAVPAPQDEKALAPYGLTSANYNLVIARMEPENHIREIVEAHVQANTTTLALVGSLETPFGQQLAQYANHPKLRWLGPIFDMQALDALRQHAALYLHGHSVGGTNPSLLEAMAAGALIAAHDNPFNRAILGENAAWFTSATELAQLLTSPWAAEHNHLREAHKQRIASDFSWNQIIDAYETLFQRLVEQR